MTFNIVVEITQRDIDEGKQSMCFYCPVAVAAQRVLKEEFVLITVENLVARGYKPVRLPLSVRQTIWDFDEGRKIEPFSFELVLEPQIEQVSPWIGLPHGEGLTA